MLRDQQSDANGGATMTKDSSNASGTGQTIDSDANLKTLLEFKKTLVEEKKTAEDKIQELNTKLEEVKKQIDQERSQLDELRSKLKIVNEEKDADYPKFLETRNSFLEAKNQIKTLNEKVGDSVASRSRKDRYDIENLTKNLDQIERDIQTKKLSKDDERKLVNRSKEIATKLHTLKVKNKKESQYKDLSSQYDKLRDKVNKIFRQKEEIGNKIGKIKESLDNLLNMRENLYEDRRKMIHQSRESGAKLEMVDTQVQAIHYKKNRTHQVAQRQRRQKESDERRFAKHEAMQEKQKRDREYQERWNSLKEAAMKKMSSGEKLTFDEMKLIFGDGNTSE